MSMQVLHSSNERIFVWMDHNGWTAGVVLPFLVTTTGFMIRNGMSLTFCIVWCQQKDINLANCLTHFCCLRKNQRTQWLFSLPIFHLSMCKAVDSMAFGLTVFVFDAHKARLMWRIVRHSSSERYVMFRMFSIWAARIAVRWVRRCEGLTLSTVLDRYELCV